MRKDERKAAAAAVPASPAILIGGEPSLPTLPGGLAAPFRLSLAGKDRNQQRMANEAM